MTRPTLVESRTYRRKADIRLGARLVVLVALVGGLFALAVVSITHLVSYLYSSLEHPNQAWAFLGLLGLLPATLVLAPFLWVAVSALLEEVSESGSVSKFTSLRVALFIAVVAASVLAALFA